jgi:dUTP pyrophosphatase
MITVNVKRANDKAHLPKFATKNSAGADLVATRIIKNGLFGVWYDCDISTDIPIGYVGLLFPRSSISTIPLMLANSVGIIDADYRGSYQVRFNRTFWGIFTRKQYKIGERIAQLIITKLPDVEYKDVKSLSATQRGTGGFGSTGKKNVTTRSNKQIDVVNT